LSERGAAHEQSYVEHLLKAGLDVVRIAGIEVTNTDVGPFFHPAMGRVPVAFEPLRLGEATGVLRSDPSRCITGTLRFAYVVGG
jgi:hypothetical protein